jgi:quinol monooxygenase YgiN
MWGKPERREHFLAAVSPLSKASNEEPGCISYRFYEDPLAPNDFVFIEEWESQEILDRHEQTPHFQSFARVLPDLVAREPEVSIYEVSAVQRKG